MSETVHYKGKALTIAKGFDECEKMAKEILKSKGEEELKSYHDNYVEQLCDSSYKEYFYHPKTESLMSISNEEIDPYDDIIRAKKVDTEEYEAYEYELRYYNGGAGFTEVLEEALDNI